MWKYARSTRHTARVSDDEGQRAQDVGALLRSARIQAGIGKREAARRANLSEGQWRIMEAGFRQVTKDITVPVRSRPETLVAAAKAVGLNSSELLEVAGYDRSALDERSTTSDDHAASTTDEAIRNDPTLSEEARAHLLNQLRLLRLLPPEAVTGEPTPRRRDHATPAEGSPVRPSAQHDRGNRATGRAARTAADAKASAGGKRPRAGAKER